MSTLTRVRTGAAFLLCVAFSTSAYAHAQLKKASPGGGSTVATVSELKLEFSEGVEPKFTTVAVMNSDGAVVPASDASIEGGGKNVLVLKFSAPLPAGVYTVNWKAVALDTHHTQGVFNFTVKP